jgi:hypothetical protein
MSQALVDPSSQDLHEVLSQVLESFAYALPVPRAEAAGLALTVSGELPEGLGWLVLRGTPALAARLAEDSTGSDDPSLGQDAFAELCNLCVSHLVSRLYSDEPRAFRAFVPQAGLPQGREVSKVLLDVDGDALEASYWRAA